MSLATFVFVKKPSDICSGGVLDLNGHITVVICDSVCVRVGSQLQIFGVFCVVIGISEVLLDPLSCFFSVNEEFFI